MTTPLAQRMLECLYRDAGVRQTAKDALADWILDTQPRDEPLNTKTLLEYLAVHQSDVLSRLKINVRIKDEIDQALRGADPVQDSRV